MQVSAAPVEIVSEDLSKLRVTGRLKPGPSQPQSEVVASQRARLQRATIEIAARHGLNGVTVRRLTKLAGVSTAAFYSRFSGTDQCVLTTYTGIMRAVTESVTYSRSPEQGPAPQIEQALRALLTHFLTDQDVSRFVLIEIYEGGPAALTVIGEEEERLVSALAGCLDRREKRIPKAVVAGVIAGVLHCIRTELIDAAPHEAKTTIDALIEWAIDVVEERDEYSLSSSVACRSTAEPVWTSPDEASRAGDEKALIEAAILRLALPDGFRGLDSSKISSASGLSAARIRRHFGTLADGYLAAIRRTSKAIFAELTAGDGPNSSGSSTRAALQKAARRAASDPAAARLIFSQVIEPGLAGLTCRETLISELAVACIDRGGESPSSRIRTKARVAALWEDLAQGALRAKLSRSG